MPRVLLFLFFAALSQAQWLDQKTPGIPRTPDGKPDLSAPTPRMNGKPDLTGLWRGDASKTGVTERAIEKIPAQPWADDLSKKRKADQYKDDMGVLCLPFGPRASEGIGRILQTPTMIALLRADLTYRLVYMDGRKLPEDPNPAFMGYSIGHWDGDTLVIESSGYNDRTWLDDQGHPHSDALRLTERITRPDFGHLVVERTYEDPKALTKPWTVPMHLEYFADSDSIEYVCTENERDRGHLIGKSGDEVRSKVAVPVDLLSKYAGVYELRPPDRPEATMLLRVILTNGELTFDVNDGTRMSMIPVAESKFFVEMEGGNVEFFRDDKGNVTHLVLSIVEGDFKAPRKL